MRWAGLVIWLLMIGFASAGPVVAAPSEYCLSPHQARDAVAEHHILPPFRVMNSMVALARAEPLDIRLCQWGERLVYEVLLLHRDGRVLRIYVDAASGRTVSPR